MMMPVRRSPASRLATRRSRALGLAGVEGLESRQLLATVVAANDTYQVIQDSLLNVAASGVLANDTPAPGETLTASVVTPPTNGTLVLNPAGTFTYVPAPGYTGLDSFVYRATDTTNGSATGTVTLNVNPSVSRATVAAGTRLANLDTTQSALLNAVLGNLAGGAALNLSAVDNAALAQGSIRGGTLLNALQTNLNLATPDQAPAANVTLPELFAAAADAAQAEGNTALVTALDGLALQLAGLTQTIRLGDLVNVVPNQGSFADASLNALDLATGGIQLFNFENVLATTTPVAVSGSALGLGSLVNNVALSATVVEPPVIVVGGVGTSFRTAGVRLKLAVDLVDQAIDTSALNSALTGLLGPLVTVNSALTVGDFDLVASVASGTGIITAIDAISRAVTLQTTPGVANVYLGTISDAAFRDRTGPIDPATDVAFGTIGSLTIGTTGLITTGGTAAIQARSSALGSAPLAGTLTFTPPYPNTQVDGSSAAFLANLASTLVSNLQIQTSGSLGGVLDPLVNGTVLPIVQPLVATTLAPVLGSLLSGVADPALTALGVGIGQEVVSVAAVGQAAPPAANPDFATTTANTLAVIPVLLNDASVVGDNIRITGIVPPANGVITINPDGTLTYNPAGNFVGTDTFSYTITGNNGTSTAVVTVAVNPATIVNGPPVANPDFYSIPQGAPATIPQPGVLSNDTDPNGDTLTAVLVAGPANGTLVLNPNGSFTYTPNPGFSGTDTFTYQASDGTNLSAAVAVTITVTPTDTVPLANPDSYQTPAGTTLTVPPVGVLANDFDPNGDPLTAVLVAGPGNGTLTLNADGSFTYTPNPGFVGTDTFTYRASDGTNLSVPVAVSLAVGLTNRPPVALPDVYSVVRGNPLVVAGPGVLGNDSDPDGLPLTASLASAPAHGTVVLNADGSFTYLPDPGYVGADSFTYRASDGALQSEPVAVTILVNAAAASAPVANPDTYTTPGGNPLTIPLPGVLGNDVSPAGTPLTAILASGPANGTLVLNPNGSFTYTPNPGFIGTDTFTYWASDGTNQSAAVGVTVVVTAVNGGPIALPDIFTGTQGTTLIVPGPGVLGNDFDPNGDPLTAVLVTGPANGTLTLNANGSFTFVPNAGFVGADSFTYRASDGSALSLPVTVSLFVVPGGNLGPAPQVTSFARFGFHQMPTSFFVQFNTALDPASAVDLANYVLVTPGRDGRFGTRDDRRVALRSATYDSALRAVTLDAGRRLDLYAAYQLTVRGSLRAAGGATGDDQIIRVSQLSLAGRSNVPIPDREALAQQIQLVRLPQGNGRIFAARGRLFQALRRQFR